MKMCFILLTAFIISIPVLSQANGALSKQDYLKKAKWQRTVATGMAAGGSALVVVGGIIWLTGFSEGLDFNNPSSSDGVAETNTGNTLLITGGILIAGSIPLFIASSKNKRRAISFSFRSERVIDIVKNGLSHRMIPSLSLKLDL